MVSAHVFGIDLLQIIDADLVLLSLGFLGPEELLSNKLGLKMDPRKNIATPTGVRSSSPFQEADASPCVTDFCHTLSSATPLPSTVSLQLETADEDSH
jgi:hypothetical protein